MSRRRLFLVPMLALLLAGCAGLRADPAITPGLDIDSNSTERVVYVPPGPQVDASPEEVIRGFLRAAAVSGEGITVARGFLTGDVASTWNPDVRAEIIGEGIEGRLARIGPQTYELTGTLVASVGPDGRYEPADSAVEASLRLTVARDSGQWRITALPPGFGRWLSRSAFAQLMAPVRVHYTGAADLLIPDIRYIVTDSMATRLARAQLLSVPDYLTGAVRSDLAGLRLRVDAVPVEAGVATVDFAGEQVSPDPSIRRGMWGQLVATLTEAPNVSAVAITVHGTGLDLGGVTPPIASAGDLGFREAAAPTGVQPLLRIGNGLYPLDPARLGQGALDTVVERPSTYPALGKQFTETAMSVPGTEVAAVAAGELARYRASGRASVPNFGRELSGPAYDRWGWLWVAGLTGQPARGALWVVDSGIWPPDADAAQARRISAPWLTGRRPIAVSVAADGTRILIVSTDLRGRASRLDVAGVVRDAGGVPTGLVATPLRLAPTLTKIADAAWIGPTDIAVLALTPGEKQVRPYVVTLGQQVRPLPDAPGARRIATLGGERRIVVTTADGLLLRAGGTWQRISVGDDLVIAGR